MSFIHINAKKPITYAIQYHMELMPDFSWNEEPLTKKDFISFVSPIHFFPHKLKYEWMWQQILGMGPNELSPIPYFFPSTYKNRILYNKKYYMKLNVYDKYRDLIDNMDGRDRLQKFMSSILLFNKEQEAHDFLHGRIQQQSYLKDHIYPYVNRENPYKEDNNDRWQENLKKDAIFSRNSITVAQLGICDTYGWLPSDFYQDMIPQFNILDENEQFNNEYFYVSGTFFETYTIKPLPLKPTLSQNEW